MKQKLVAPIAALIATIVSVGRLTMITQTFSISGIGNVGFSSIFEYLFGNAGTLEPNVSLHMLFATTVLWMIVFSIVWLVLSIISKDQSPQPIA